jgi:asparagine synthase (glutamine-hydrolysing)
VTLTAFDPRGQSVCGLVGLVGVAEPELTDILIRMRDCLTHRGPDSQGLWTDSDRGVGLGHRRLAILDLSETGHQPMLSHDGRWVVALNGEIYDFLEHRTALESSGVRFRGTSDTEVLVELIARRGVKAALQSIDGMFALAIFDRDRGDLWLARDRMGEKPLYYGMHSGRLSFASEIHALRRLPWVSQDPDPTAVAEFVRLGYVPAPWSIMREVYKLAPGHYLRVSARGVMNPPEEYWSLDQIVEAGRSAPLMGSDDELADALDQALRDSISRRLLADVPLGVFLSGGLDSSTVAAIAQDVSSSPVRTFTVAVGGDADESDSAAVIARHLGTTHTTIPLPAVDPVAASTRVAEHYDEPFADPSAIPTMLLSQAARDHVTVCLSGDGADELLGGYNRHKVATGRLSSVLRVPRPIRAPVGRALGAVPVSTLDRLADRLPVGLSAPGTKAHKLATVLCAVDSQDAYAALATQWSGAEVLQPWVLEAARSAGEAVIGRLGSLSAVLHHEQAVMLPDNMLVKTDRASMSVGLEVRVPFLAHSVVELSWRLPDAAKVRGGQGKWVERRVLERYVPRPLWDRPKVGFDPPLAAWLRGPLRPWTQDLLSPERLTAQGLLRPEPIQAALREHLQGRTNHDYALWTILMLQAHLEFQAGAR